MRYWYTVIFILLGVFILMAIIIKVCGKKTPLVRSRRKRRRQTIQHEQDIIDNPDDVQVHPTAIEPSVPLGKLFLSTRPLSSYVFTKCCPLFLFLHEIGKKVRKDQRPKKRRSKSRKRSTPTSSSSPTSPVTSSTSNANIETPLAASSEAKVEDGVARAVRLAANLSNQLFVDLPPEQPRNSTEVTANASNGKQHSMY